MSPYRAVLATPGLAALLAVSFGARVAITAAAVALTLQVVLDLGLGYASAGIVAAALTAGMAFNGPLLGRLVDAHGVRTVLVTTTAAQVLFWSALPLFSYGVLVGATFVAGLMMVPAQLVTRLAILGGTTGGQRQAALALESVQGEIAYVIGPPVVILTASGAAPAAVAWAVGAAMAVGGIGMAVLDPSQASEDPAEVGRRPGGIPLRAWLDRRLVGTLVMAFGATAALSGTDVAIVASLRNGGALVWGAVVVGVFGSSSVVGGLVYGSLGRRISPPLLLGMLGLGTGIAALAGDWRWLCVAGVGAGVFAAPALISVSQAVGDLAPGGARGVAAGLQSSALSAGVAAGAPLAGSVIDAGAPPLGFTVVAATAIAAAAAGALLNASAQRGRSSTVAGSRQGVSVPTHPAGGRR